MANRAILEALAEMLGMNNKMGREVGMAAGVPAAGVGGAAAIGGMTSERGGASGNFRAAQEAGMGEEVDTSAPSREYGGRQFGGQKMGGNRYGGNKFGGRGQQQMEAEVVEDDPGSKHHTASAGGGSDRSGMARDELEAVEAEELKATMADDIEASDSGEDVHEVQEGETLSQIAKDVLGDAKRWKEIAELNGMDDPDLIMPGQQIRLPAPSAPTRNPRRK